MFISMLWSNTLLCSPLHLSCWIIFHSRCTSTHMATNRHIQRQTHTQKKGCWLFTDLFTQPCSLAADLQPESSSCAESGGWDRCQAPATWGRGGGGGIITLSSKVSSPDWGPSGKEKGCQRPLALQPLTVCLCEIEWVSICLCCTGLCSHNLFRSLTCLGGVRTVHFRNIVQK